MADVINTQQIGQMATAGANTMYLLLIIVFLLALVFGTMFFVIWWNSFKIKFRVFIITGTKSLVRDRFAKVIRKKGQAPKWKLRGGGYVPIPQPDQIGLGQKGNLCVEADFTENGEYIYRKMTSNLTNLKDSDMFDPLTTIDKEFFANEFIDGVTKYKKKNIMEILLQLAPALIMLIVFIMLLAFWGKVVEPFKEIGSMIIEEREQERQFLLEMHDIHRVIVGNKTVPLNEVAPS